MRYQVVEFATVTGGTARNVSVDQGNSQYLSFPAEVGNPVYGSFLESQSLTDAEVQAMEPDVWHDMA